MIIILIIILLGTIAFLGFKYQSQKENLEIVDNLKIRQAALMNAEQIKELRTEVLEGAASDLKVKKALVHIMKDIRKEAAKGKTEASVRSYGASPILVMKALEDKGFVAQHWADDGGSGINVYWKH